MEPSALCFTRNTHPDPIMAFWSAGKSTISNVPVRYVILTCHSYVTVYLYCRYSHLKSLSSYFGLQVSRTHPHVYYSFLLRTSAIQSLTQTGYGPRPLDCAPTAVFIVLSSSAGILDTILGTPPRNTYPSHPARLHCDWVAGTLVTLTFSFHLNWHFRYFRLSSVHSTFFSSFRLRSVQILHTHFYTRPCTSPLTYITATSSVNLHFSCLPQFRFLTN